MFHRELDVQWNYQHITRINAENTGQFERTLIIADKGSYVSYLEGCTAPKRDTAQLHAAVVEIVVEEDAEVKYSTVQNWFPVMKMVMVVFITLSPRERIAGVIDLR